MFIDKNFNYVCSLGTLCHTAYFIKRHNLKKCSYPFDWIFSNINVVIDCLKDDFKKFLDKDNYIDHSSNNPELCGHKIYNSAMFNHTSPRTEEGYEYYVRCVNRFRNLLLKKEKKLFVIMSVNDEHNNIENSLIELNNELKNITCNFNILYINHHAGILENSHSIVDIDNIDNIDILELCTTSISNGVDFNDNDDNIYLDKIFTSNYKFDIIDEVKREEINYVCSLGFSCHSAFLLKRNNLKKCSYPFDWIYSNFIVVIDSLTDNFEKFLDKDNLIDHMHYTPYKIIQCGYKRYLVRLDNDKKKKKNQCGHKLYGSAMFNHSNPRNQDVYEYYERCIVRFNNLLDKKEKKLFVIVNVNNEDNERNNYEDHFKNLNEILNKKSINYRILYINHIGNQTENNYKMEKNENIDLLHLYTKSNSTGVTFIDNNDNIYLNSILEIYYDFNILDEIHNEYYDLE